MLRLCMYAYATFMRTCIYQTFDVLIICRTFQTLKVTHAGKHSLDHTSIPLFGSSDGLKNLFGGTSPRTFTHNAVEYLRSTHFFMFRNE